MSGLVNKVKEVLHSDKHSNTPEGTHGPHSSRAANAADPRVDSDRDHRAAPGGLTGTTGTHTGAHTSGLAGTHTTHTGAGAYGSGPGPAPHTAGPHGSDALNKVDPRVDSDMDGSRHTGAGAGFGTTGHSTGLGHNTHNTHTTGTGLTGTHGHTGVGAGAGYGTSHNTAGPHNSDALNKVDPRVDSDLDGSRTVGGAGTGYGHTGSSGLTGSTGYGSNTTTGYNDPTGTHGPHSSRVANAADPRVDSDRDHRGAHHTSGLGSGPAPNTAGPHKSDVLNKLDPRVDSDRDGSKTVGGNQTYQ